jgi:tRNA dimethylallyltransferase
LEVLAIFGPTGVGKTGIAIAVAEEIRRRGEDPVAINCDSIQVYAGLELLSGAATEEERARLEHRLLGLVPLDGEFSAGRFANLAHAEIDQLLAEGRRQVIVGGTGLYLRAALADLDLRPPVSPDVREHVERELAERGPAALHAELDPDLAATVHPNDRKRIARLIELERAGIEPHRSTEGLWTESLRHPTVLAGITVDRDELARRVNARVDGMVAAGARDEARRAVKAGASRTALAAIGLQELLAEDIDGMKRAHLAYARRQLTWMRRMPGVLELDRTGRDDAAIAAEIVAALG